MARRGWPQNLIERGGYYSWRHPQTRREFGLGRDKAEAFAEAIEANNSLAGTATKRRLIDRLTGDDERTVGAWLDRYSSQLAERELADNTRRTYKSLAKRIAETLGAESMIERVSVREVADMLDGLKAEGKARMAQSLRSFASDAFRAAQAAGWIASNPVPVTERVKVKVTRARMTLDVFTRVYAAEQNPWLKNAMALALVTAQRREEISAARFADFRDGGWWCAQRKTGTQVFIPLDLRLDAIGLSLGDVVKQCRSTGILSQHLIHQTTPTGNSPRGKQIWVDTISRRFSESVAALGIDWGDKSPPTFHEIRSLSERQYDKQGNVNTQHLLGHKDARSTAVYKDRRGAEWIMVEVAK